MLRSYCVQQSNSKVDEVSPKNINGPHYTPLEIAKLYGFPNDADGTGQTIGIIQFGGGYTLSDFHAYLTAVGVTKVPTVTDVSVNGGVNNPTQVNESFEVCLDLDIIGAIAPGAAIRIYFAPNSISNFATAVQAAVNDNCNIISISWGLTELYWPSYARSSLNSVFQVAASKGVTIFCAAGDNGATDGQTGLNVDFPGSSPYGVCCGGTKITSAGGVIISETVWGSAANSATGGGSSAIFPKPSYQNAVPLLTTRTYRGAPDISANADPDSGYIIRVGASLYAVGGTSAVAPLLAAYVARMNQKRAAAAKPRLGFIHPTLYNAPLSVFHDITVGGNFGYDAAVGWDFTTGLGSPSTALSSYLLNFENFPVASFTTNALSGTVPFVVNCTDTSTSGPTAWAWDFGNGSTSTVQNPSVTYIVAGTYTLRLTVTNMYGLATTTKTVVASAPTPPVSSFTANKLSGTAPCTVTFTNTSTVNGLPTTYAWNFGNGTTSALQQPGSVTYTSASTYTISLTVSNSGGTSTFTKTVTVTAAPAVPTSVFTTSVTSGVAPLTVTFTNNSTGNPTAWLWNFGNGMSSTLQNPGPVVYTVPRSYVVSLRVNNSVGSSMSTKTITVLQSPPVANFVFTNRTVNFTDTSSDGATSWLWTFGDGTTSSVQNPVKTYVNAGTYSVTLRATNSRGSTAVTKTVTVN